MLGHDSRRDSVAIHRRVGYVPGDIGLPDRITGRDLLDWLARLRGGVDPATVRRLTDRFSVELDRPVRTLSKGNRQSLTLVQAFVHRPELLLLDEPTAGLDPIVQHEFQLLVREVAAEGATVFLSSHVLDEVQHLCDRVAIIRSGALVDVEAVSSLRDHAVREVTIRFADPVDPAPFASLPRCPRRSRRTITRSACISSGMRIRWSTAAAPAEVLEFQRASGPRRPVSALLHGKQR